MNLEFCMKNRSKLAEEPSDTEDVLMSTVLNVPREGSAGLFLRSRTHVIPKPETCVGWLKRGICWTEICSELASTRL